MVMVRQANPEIARKYKYERLMALFDTSRVPDAGVINLTLRDSLTLGFEPRPEDKKHMRELLSEPMTAESATEFVNVLESYAIKWDWEGFNGTFGTENIYPDLFIDGPNYNSGFAERTLKEKGVNVYYWCTLHRRPEPEPRQ